MKSTSPFSPWSPSSSDTDGSASGASELQQAAELLREAANALLEANRGGTSSASPLSIQITVTDGLGDGIPFSATTSGTDANLIS